jgi:hypothetical protein
LKSEIGIAPREALFLGRIPPNGVDAPDHSGVVDEAARELHSQSRRRNGNRVCADRSLIAVFIVAAVQAVGTKVSTAFTEVGNSLK